MNAPNDDGVLQPLVRDNEQNIYNFLNQKLSQYKHGDILLSIILTNGDTINGIFDELYNIKLRIFLLYSQLDFDLPYTNPYVHSSFIYFFIDIPLEDIAGIEQIDITFKDRDDAEMGYTKILCTNTIKRAEKHGFSIEWVPAPGVGVIKFEWYGLIKINNNELLYVDWNLVKNNMSNMSVGLNPIPFLNITWAKSLRSIAFDKIKSKPITIDQILKSKANTMNFKENNLANVDGYVEFIDNKEINLGGKSWIPAFICDKRIENISSIKMNNWILCIFQEDSMIFNKKTIQSCGNLRIFGELLSMSIDTDIGKKDLVLKAIIAGFIKT